MSKRDTILEYVDRQFPIYRQIALDIHARPEVSNYEFFACKTLSEQLEKEGFDVKVDVAGHRTGFTATYASSRPGPVLCFLAEYDALNGMGHACEYMVRENGKRMESEMMEELRNPSPDSPWIQGKISS